MILYSCYSLIDSSQTEDLIQIENDIPPECEIEYEVPFHVDMELNKHSNDNATANADREKKILGRKTSFYLVMF